MLFAGCRKHIVGSLMGLSLFADVKLNLMKLLEVIEPYIKHQ